MASGVTLPATTVAEFAYGTAIDAQTLQAAQTWILFVPFCQITMSSVSQAGVWSVLVPATVPYPDHVTSTEIIDPDGRV